jgi:hypothetical protein
MSIYDDSEEFYQAHAKGRVPAIDGTTILAEDEAQGLARRINATSGSWASTGAYGRRRAVLRYAGRAT